MMPVNRRKFIKEKAERRYASYVHKAKKKIIKSYLKYSLMPEMGMTCLWYCLCKIQQKHGMPNIPLLLNWIIVFLSWKSAKIHEQLWLNAFVICIFRTKWLKFRGNIVWLQNLCICDTYWIKLNGINPKYCGGLKDRPWLCR